jgi:hypothetical protein
MQGGDYFYTPEYDSGIKSSTKRGRTMNAMLAQEIKYRGIAAPGLLKLLKSS